MFVVGVILVALALLFGLTELALAADGRVRHPLRIVLVLCAALAIGLAFLME